MNKLCFLLLLIPALLFSGCINEETNNCVRGVSLRFTYLLNPKFRCLFTEQVADLSLYLYNEANELIETRYVSASELLPGNRLQLDLPNGEYNITVWGNLNTTYYTTENYEKYETFRLQANCAETNEITAPLGSLFYGSCRLKLKTYQNEEQTVEMIKNTNLIRIWIEKYKAQPASPTVFERYDFAMSGSNGMYDAGNNNISASCYQYPGEQRVDLDPTHIEVDYVVLRLAENDDVTLRVKNKLTGQVLDEIAVVKELMLHPHLNTNEDLDRYDEYLLRYELDETGVLTLIAINDWFVTNQGGGV